MTESWHCEECGERYFGTQPERIEVFPGPEGDVELWFCGECVRYER